VNIFPSAQGYHRTAPDARAIEQATSILADASNPLMIVSDRISQSGAAQEAVRVAELLGCPVHTTIMNSEMNFPESHPQFRGLIRFAYPESKEILDRADAILLVGKMASGYYMFSKPRLDYFGPNTKLIHIDTDPTQVGTTQRTDVGIVADPKVTLADLAESLDTGMSGSARETAKGRAAGLAEETLAKRDAWERNLKAHWNDTPMSRERMAYEVAQAVPDDTIIADDSVTARDAVHSAFQFDQPQSFYGGRGGALGWGMGGTLGVKLAHPDRPVIGILGDGSAMMTVQGLWTASVYNIPAVYVVCNNGSYRVLKVNMNAYKTLIEGQETPISRYIGMDFPLPFDIAGMAEAMGVYGRRVEDPADIAPEIDRALASGKPAVIDVVIDGKV
jgi:benzoylformate decarboxylase